MESFIANFLKNNSNNFFGEIALLRPYLRKINSNYTAESKIIKLSNTRIKYENITLEIPLLKELFTNLTKNAFKILLNHLLYLNEDEIPSDLNIINLKDNPSNNSPNYSFLNNNSNLKKFDNFLLKRLFTAGDLLLKNLGKNINNKFEFNKKKVDEYLNYRLQFLKYILILLHIFSGAPVRGTELITLKIKNETFQLNRNIYIDEKTHLLYLIIYYHKGLSSSNSYVRNIKFIPQEITRLLLIYLIFIYPFYQYIVVKNYPENTNTLNYLFENKNELFTSNILSRVLQENSILYLNHEISIAPFRHLLIYIIREFIDKNIMNLNNSSDSNSDFENIENLLANHSTATGNKIYARDQFLAKNIRPDYFSKAREFALLFFNYYKINEYVSINILKHIRQKSSISTPTNYPAAKKQLTNINFYSENYTPEEIFENKLKRRDLYNISDQTLDLNTQLILLYSNIFPTNSPDNNKNISNQQKLKTIQFRSNQKEAITEILNKTPCITYISGTGSGKSLLFLLPAFIEKHIINIIILPLVSLKNDMLEKCKKFQLKAVIFENKKSALDNANIILISIETIINKEFQQYINKLQGLNTEFRLFFDEIHLVVTQANFRYIMKYVGEINLFKANLIYLTATYPLKIQEIIEKQMKLSSNLLIRNSVSRSNIKYQLIYHKSKSEIDDLKAYINLRKSQLKNNDKIIIYVTNIKLCDFISKELNIDKYYANYKDKEIEFEQFKTDVNHQIMVATSALGLGIDMDNIREVIHIFKQYKLIDYF